MKRFMISELMDEYVDQEVFPQGGESVDTGAVKARVLAKAAPAKKRRMPRWKTALIAAALAVGAILCIAAALPIISYQQVDGSSMLVQTDGEHYLYIGYNLSGWEKPIVLEGGRLWMVAGGRHTDITDLIDEKTPYIVEGADSVSGLKSYLIVGGTPEDFGWEQWSEMPLGDYMGSGWNCYKTYATIDGVDYLCNDLPEEQLAQASHTFTVNNEWCQNGRDALHLWD